MGAILLGYDELVAKLKMKETCMLLKLNNLLSI